MSSHASPSFALDSVGTEARAARDRARAEEQALASQPGHVLRALAARWLSALIAISAASGLLLEYLAGRANHPNSSLLWSLLHTLSYFTVLSNLLIALSCATGALLRGGRLRRWVLQPALRGAGLLYILVTALVYHIVLADHDSLRGLDVLASDLLHDVVPMLYTLGWLWLAPPGALRWRYLTGWMTLPALYLLWILLLGQLLHAYPYPFLNLTRLGPELLLRNAALLALLFALLGAVLVELDLGVRAAARTGHSRR
jgi:hypothetical protein